MVVASFVIAIVGLLLGLASLAWQVVSWVREGPRVTVWTQGVRLTTFGAGTSGPLVAVRARNVGRGDVQVNSWGLEHPDGTGSMFQPLPEGDHCPMTLIAGHEAVFLAPLDQYQKGYDGHGAGAMPWVKLATGQTVTGKAIGRDGNEL